MVRVQAASRAFVIEGDFTAIEEAFSWHPVLEQAFAKLPSKDKHVSKKAVSKHDSHILLESEPWILPLRFWQHCFRSFSRQSTLASDRVVHVEPEMHHQAGSRVIHIALKLTDITRPQPCDEQCCCPLYTACRLTVDFAQRTTDHGPSHTMGCLACPICDAVSSGGMEPE